VPRETGPNSGPIEPLLALEPQYRERVWGGKRLRRTDPPIGEAWVACGDSRVTSGAAAGATLDSLAARDSAAILGEPVVARFGTRFPLIVKLLDTAEWLSVQVHPNDEQARRMVGPGEFGKTEAWYFIDTDRGAQIMAGVKTGVGGAELAAAIRGGGILDVANHVPVREGEAIVIPAGTLHALGPGLLLYEIQEASDTTYRVYDWDRPQSAGRKLHIEESVEVTLPVGPDELRRPQVVAATGSAPAIDCDYFHVDVVELSAAGGPLAADTEGRRFHILTGIEGAVEIRCGAEKVRLGRFETVLVAGSAGPYAVEAVDGRAVVLRAAVPD
jgi:mannose-6-phosphate isomerase